MLDTLEAFLEVGLNGHWISDVSQYIEQLVVCKKVETRECKSLCFQVVVKP